MTDTSSSIHFNVTLEDDAWKDTFDKLLDPRPVLRALNVLKKDVRASFNNNSSVDNSNDIFKDIISTPQAKTTSNQQPKNSLMTKTISTPVGRESLKKPFKCTLSPIGAWRSIFSDKSAASELESDVQNVLQATPISLGDRLRDTESEGKAGNFNKKNINFRRLTKNVVIVSPTKSLIKILPEKCQSKKTKVKTKKRSNQKHILFECADDDLQKSRKLRKTVPLTPSSTCPKLQTGKWRKSMNIWRRTQIAQNARKSENNRNSCHFAPSDTNDSVINLSIAGRHRKSIFLRPERQTEDFYEVSRTIVRDVWQERVLKYCVQNTILDFSKTYKFEDMTGCRKIGEGAYGEVFMNVVDDSSKNTVLKVIPIDGTDLINGEVQKSFELILPEIVISLELSKLNNPNEATNSTCGFVEIHKVVCVKGKYPKHLLDLWENFDNEKGSENDNPDTLPSEQIYIVLELSYGGKDLETFVFNNAEQSYYALLQVILTLAVGEATYKFEHRDLHWGNILLINTSQKSVIYKLDDKTLTLPTKGVRTTIIDYTLSRMTCADCCFYNDLSNDQDLFSASGDYQFDIYRMMRDILKNNWEKSETKTNIFWISYVIKKLLQDVTYKSTRTKTHATYIKKLRQIDQICLDFNSALELAKYLRNF